MKVRSLEELVAAIDGSLAWRRREVSVMFGLSAGKKELEKEALARALLALIYAHWEGFVKDAALAYYRYVKTKNSAVDQLAPAFRAITLRNSLRTSPEGVRRIGAYRAALGLISPGGGAKLPPDSGADMESNLSYAVFEDVADTLGIDVSLCATKRNLISEKLVANRHRVAHGERVSFDEATLGEIRAGTFWCMEHFRDQVERAASQKLYEQRPVTEPASPAASV